MSPGSTLWFARHAKHEIAVEPKVPGRVRYQMHDLARWHLGADLMELKLEGRDDAEVATPTAEVPEER